MILVLNGVTKHAAVFALKRPKFGAPDPTPDLRDISEPTQRYGLPVQPMESFFTFLSFAAWNPAVQKLYVQLSPPDDLLHSRGEARAASAIAMDHPVLGRSPDVGQAIERLHAAVPHLVLADVSPKLDELRWVKSDHESQRLRQAGRIGAAAVAEAIKGAHPGMYEYEIAAAAQYVNTRLGTPRRRVPADRAFGTARADRALHGQHEADAGGRAGLYGLRLRLAVLHLGYHPHLAGLGAIQAEQEKMYRCVLEARNAIIGAMKPGVTIASLQDVAAAVYAKYGYGKEFEATGRYIGHFVGIAVHDVIDIGGRSRTASRSWPARCSTSSRSWSFPSARLTSGWRTP